MKIILSINKYCFYCLYEYIVFLNCQQYQFFKYSIDNFLLILLLQKIFQNPKRMIMTKNKSQSINIPVELNFHTKQQKQNQNLIPLRHFLQNTQKVEKLQQKCMFYTNNPLKGHDYEQIKISNFQKKYHIIDSPQVIFKIADLIQHKQNLFNSVNFQQNQQYDNKKISLHTSQSKFCHNSGERKKFYNLIEDFKDQIQKLDNHKNLTIIQVFEYKQHILNTYFHSITNQIQKECIEKAKLMQSIWSTNISLMSTIFKILVNKINDNQSNYLTEIQNMHNQYQKYLKQYFEQNKLLKKSNREKSEFIQNLIFNLRYKRRQIKHLNISIGLASRKLNQYKDIYIELENRHIELQMETKDISKQLSRFLNQRKKMLIQEKRKRFKLNRNKMNIKKIIFEQLKNESDTLVKDLNKTLLEGYLRSRKQKGDKYLMIEDLDEFALKINDDDDYPLIVEDQEFGFIDQGINTDQINLLMAEFGVQFDIAEIQKQSYKRNISIQVDSINQANYFNKLKDHIKNKFIFVQKIVDLKICIIQIDKYKFIINKQKSEQKINSITSKNKTNSKTQSIISHKLQIISDSNMNKQFSSSLIKKDKAEISKITQIIEAEETNKETKGYRSSNFKIKNKSTLSNMIEKLDNEYLQKQKQKKKNQIRLKKIGQNKTKNNSKFIEKKLSKAIYKRKLNFENNLTKSINQKIKNESIDFQNKLNQQYTQANHLPKLNQQYTQANHLPIHKKIIIFQTNPLINMEKTPATLYIQQQLINLQSKPSLTLLNIDKRDKQLQHFQSKFNSQEIFSMLLDRQYYDDEVQKEHIREQSIQCPQNQVQLLEDFVQQNIFQLEKFDNNFTKIDDITRDVSFIEEILCKYLIDLKKSKKEDLINQKQYSRNSLKYLTNLLKTKPKRGDSMCINDKNDSKTQNIIKIIHDIYHIGYKYISKNNQLKSLSECIYQIFRLNYGCLDKNLIVQKIIDFLNLVNRYKFQNQKIKLFALLCGMQVKNQNTNIICENDFVLFLKLYFYLNKQSNLNSNYINIQRFNQRFYMILVEYVGYTFQTVIKKQFQTLLDFHQNLNEKKRQNLKINSEKSLIFIFNLILQQRLIFYQQYKQFLNILKIDEFEVISIQTFQFLASCFQHKKIEYAYLVKNFAQECDLNYYNKKSMSSHKFTYFCLKYNFHTFRAIYQICVQNLQQRNLNQVSIFFHKDNDNNNTWLKQLQYMTKQLKNADEQMIIEKKLLKYMTNSFTKNLKDNQEIITMIYVMLWNKIFDYQSQRFLTFMIGKHCQLLYSYGFQVNTTI